MTVQKRADEYGSLLIFVEKYVMMKVYGNNHTS